MKTSSNRQRNALLASGFGGLLFTLCYSVLGMLSPGYIWRRDTISALEFTTYGTAQRINFAVFGIALCSFAFALRGEMRSGRGARLIPIFQFGCGVAVVGDAVYIHDPMHLACDLIAFNSALLVLFLFAWRFAGDSRWRGWTTFSILTAFLMMAFLTAFGLSLRDGGPAGAYEKLASFVRTLWSVSLVLSLYAGRVISTSEAGDTYESSP